MPHVAFMIVPLLNHTFWGGVKLISLHDCTDAALLDGRAYGHAVAKRKTTLKRHKKIICKLSHETDIAMPALTIVNWTRKFYHDQIP